MTVKSHFDNGGNKETLLYGRKIGQPSELAKDINDRLIPQVTARIIEILSPSI